MAARCPGYQELWASVAAAAWPEQPQNAGWQGVQLPEPAELNKEQVLWPDVVQALTDPLKFFVRRRLKASLDSDWEQHDTSEPFAPAGLDGLSAETQLAATHAGRAAAAG